MRGQAGVVSRLLGSTPALDKLSSAVHIIGSSFHPARRTQVSRHLSNEDVATLNAARTILNRLGRSGYQAGDDYNVGLVAAMAEVAEGAVFRTINYADTYYGLHLAPEQLHNTKTEAA